MDDKAEINIFGRPHDRRHRDLPLQKGGLLLLRVFAEEAESLESHRVIELGLKRNVNDRSQHRIARLRIPPPPPPTSRTQNYPPPPPPF
jgi:hypothetical protein